MASTTEIHPQWNRYRALVDETSELEYQIIGIVSNALSRKEGNGKPTELESKEIAEIKTVLKVKIKELNSLHPEVSEVLETEKAISASRLKR